MNDTRIQKSDSNPFIRWRVGDGPLSFRRLVDIDDDNERNHRRAEKRKKNDWVGKKELKK